MKKRHRRRGFSLLEITIGSLMAALIAITASGVAYDVSRHLVDNIIETEMVAEARLAIESFRRDLGGSLPEERSGHRTEWRLVGRMIPNNEELRLCFDGDRDASADWIAPDRVITYWRDGNRLVRSDAVAGTTYTVARHVRRVKFDRAGGEIIVEIEFDLRGIREKYSFVTADLP